MSGSLDPQQITVDPTPQALQPIQNQLGKIFETILGSGGFSGGLQGGFGASPFPGAPSAFEQLFGIAPQFGSTAQPPPNLPPNIQPPPIPGGGGPNDPGTTPGTGGSIGNQGGGTSQGTNDSGVGGTLPPADLLSSSFPGGGVQGSTTLPTGGGTPPGGGQTTPSGGSLASLFNLPMFGGPFAAPLTGGQLTALQGFGDLFNPEQIVNTNQLQNAVTSAIGGNQIFDPQNQGTLSEFLSPFDTTGENTQGVINSLIGNNQQGFSSGDFLPANFQQAFETALSPQRADLTELFQTGEDILQRDLQDVTARARESASAFGLNPGSADRTRTEIESAGDVLNRFRLGQQQQGIQAFENAANRQAGAVGLGAPFLNSAAGAANLGNQNLLNLLPSLQNQEAQTFSNFFNTANPAAQRAQQTLSMLPGFSNLPFQQAQGLFDINNQARGIADLELQRMMAEFQRTQGGGLNQILGLFGNAFPTNTGFGPSAISQFGNVLGGIGSIIPG